MVIYRLIFGVKFMKDRFDDNSLMKMEDKLLDLKYEKKVLKNEKKHTILKLILDFLRPIGLLILDFGHPAFYIWFSIYAGLNRFLGFGVLGSFCIYLIPEGILLGLHIVILDAIDKWLTGGELIFLNPRFDKMANDVKYLKNVNSKIKSKNNEISAINDISKSVRLTDDQIQSLVSKRREELVSLVSNDYLDDINVTSEDVNLTNYYPKASKDDLKQVKKLLNKYKKIEKEKEYEKSKEKVKKKIKDELYY